MNEAMDPRIQAMLERHYRNEYGYCAHCMTSDGYEGESQEWPCDAAVLLQGQGYTLREDPLYVAPPRDPNEPEFFPAALWSDELHRVMSQKLVFADLLETGDTINIPHIRSLELRA